jgi:hypothetical protein
MNTNTKNWLLAILISLKWVGGTILVCYGIFKLFQLYLEYVPYIIMALFLGTLFSHLVIAFKNEMDDKELEKYVNSKRKK